MLYALCYIAEEIEMRRECGKYVPAKLAAEEAAAAADAAESDPANEQFEYDKIWRRCIAGGVESTFIVIYAAHAII